jgi:hypothetical protein
MSCIGLFLAMSMHIGLEANYNNIHPHARCTVDNKIAGVYYNSEDRVSAYIGKQFELAKGHIELGIVSGYTATEMLPMIRYKQENFFLAPAYEKHNNEENFGLVLGWEIGK